MPLAALLDFAVLVFLKTAGTERNTVKQFYSRSDLACLANHYTRAMVYEKVRANLCARMDIDSRAAVRPLGHDARNQGQPLYVKLMRHPLDRDRFKRRISQNYFLIALRRRIALIGRINIRPQQFAHLRKPRHETSQKFLGLCFGCLVGWDLTETSADLGFESRVQISHSSPGRFGQIFGAHQRLTAKAREHQAHQLSASRLDTETRGERCGSVQITEAASLAISLEQFINRVT